MNLFSSLGQIMAKKKKKTVKLFLNHGTHKHAMQAAWFKSNWNELLLELKDRYVLIILLNDEKSVRIPIECLCKCKTGTTLTYQGWMAVICGAAGSGDYHSDLKLCCLRTKCVL